MFSGPDRVARQRSDADEQGWQRIAREVRHVDPKVVVFDLLLSGDQADHPFSGIIYANRCKTEWPECGVVVVTTGGDQDLGGIIKRQKDVDEQKKQGGWPVDFAWVKPWGPAGDSPKATKVEADMAGLIRRSKRPSVTEA